MLAKRSKYGNIKTNGFDSKKESIRMKELKLLEKAGKIKNLKFQIPFVLLEAQKVYSQEKQKWIIQRAIYYIPDAIYHDEIGRLVAEDVKGFKTDVYKLKRKFFIAKYPEIPHIEI